MAVYQDRAKERIKNEVRKVRALCNNGKKTNMGEADTRAIVQKVLTDMLGWEMIGDVTQETGIKGGYCDFMVSYEGKPFAIIEVKKISGGLTENHLTQARHYAQDNPLNWVILTNGDEWQVHYLYYNKKRGKNPEPMLFHLFTTSFTDTTINPSERVEMLYLLSKEAKRHDELDDYYNLLQALSPQELTKRLLRADVMDRVRIGIRNDIGFRIDNDELASRILEIIKDNAVPENSSYLVKKLKK